MKTKWYQRGVAAILGILFVIGSVTGCGTGTNVSQEQIETEVFTDSLGREVEVPVQIDRYAVTGSLAQIVLFAIAPDEMVAVSSAWSEDALLYLDEKYAELPVLGQLYGGDQELNEEEIINTEAQVIIDVGEAKTGIEEEMDSLQEKTGIATVHIDTDTEHMGDAYRLLGQLLGKEKKAEELAIYCEDVYTRITDIMEQVGDNRKSVLYCLGDVGCNVICRDSYQSEILDLLTDNQAVVDNPTAKGTGNEVDFEQILNWDPEVIFFAPSSIYSVVEEKAQWQQLQAIQSGQYYEVPYGPLNWMGFPPSVQRYLGMLWMTKVLYPEQAQYDLYEETANYFELFYHCTLTEEQYDQLMENSM